MTTPTTPDIILFSWGTKSKSPHPPICDIRVDVSTWRNPETTRALSALSPRDEAIQAFVKEDVRVLTLIDSLHLWLEDRWTAQNNEREHEPTMILITDHHGRLHAPAVVEAIAAAFVDAYADTLTLVTTHLSRKE